MPVPEGRTLGRAIDQAMAGALNQPLTQLTKPAVISAAPLTHLRLAHTAVFTIAPQTAPSWRAAALALPLTPGLD